MTKSNPRTSRWRKADRVALIIILLLIAVLGYVALRPAPRPDIPFSVNNFRVDLSGKSIHDYLGNVRLRTGVSVAADPFPPGKVYLLEFYFQSCPPCRMKHPALQKIAAMMDNSEVEIVYVDNGKIDKWIDFFQQNDATEKKYYDSAALLIRNLQIKSFPFEVIVDKEGIIRYVSKGYNKDGQEQYINATIDKLKSLL